ncbi:Uncharacterised protein [Neisseria gonorrhoeae]|uniref:Uncharacterized protein n=1 Tax=Neisseria gonorrhoeae TaxID=485 RepID=A0A378VZ49_NEIGO|nr:Uncharacterised protein [Neisseria gonorrhoeae]
MPSERKQQRFVGQRVADGLRVAQYFADAARAFQKSARNSTISKGRFLIWDSTEDKSAASRATSGTAILVRPLPITVF